ncbi:hypothetical protein Cflav_PD5119 [Pedosphaera parvula Ellin514]|uniref:Uncharacterized protein n=1 Tax=Pedosphaera parvula (strain Ellin514) TaxID=320771 RepID=B9XC16_PEDPL|nr:hypothetical protein Cflav_PD5119 [Pedosphaera parvula Ellin514]
MPGGIFKDDPHENSYAIAKKVTPKKLESKNQTAEAGVSDGINPRSVIQLADFDRGRECGSGGSNSQSANGWENKSESQKDHQRPKNVSYKEREDAGIVTGCQSKTDYRNNPNAIDEAASRILGYL